MENELEEIKRTMQDIAQAVAKMVGRSEIATQKQIAELAMDAKKSIVRISDILNIIKRKEGEK